MALTTYSTPCWTVSDPVKITISAMSGPTNTLMDTVSSRQREEDEKQRGVILLVIGILQVEVTTASRVPVPIGLILD